MIVNRSIYGRGKSKVKKGDKVVPETIVLEGETPGGFRSIVASQILGVKGKELILYLLKQVGDKVQKGDRLAFKKSLGFIKKEVLSPIPGVIREMDLKNGIISVQLLPEFDRVTAGCWGEVLEVGETSVKIKTAATEIYGVAGAGRLRQGVIKVVSQRDEFLISQKINEGQASKIIVGGSLIVRDAFAKALALGVSGIIAGGMHAFEFVSAGGKILEELKSSDVGLTVVLTEGFGPAPIPVEIFEVLKRNDGRLAVINGEENKLTIPLQTDKKLQASLADLTQAQRALAIGDNVRIIGSHQLGFVGQLTNIAKKSERLPNGLEAVLATVKSAQQETRVPVQNLEIIV